MPKPKIVTALGIIVVPLVILYVFLFVLPGLSAVRGSDSVLDRKFTTVDADNNVREKPYIDEAYLNDAARNQIAFQQKIARNDVYYHDLDIRERINKNTEFYPIEASDPDELREKIVMFAPENASTGKKSVTKVTYGVDWSLDTRQEEGECKFYGANIVTSVTMMVPQWVGIEGQPDDVKEQWGSFLTSVSKYEATHNQIMIDVSRDIANRIRFIPKQSLCSDLIEKVNVIGNHGLDLAKEKMKRYRYETAGGRYFGVKMPAFARRDYVESVETE